MRLRTGLAFQIGQLAHAEPTHHFWGGPDPTGLELYRRQDGYNPELGTCGVGLTCAAACGDGFEACSAKETSILFCFNPGAGQTCCPGGSGRACDAGFYCVNDPNGGQTYCCDEQLDLSQCALDLGISTVVAPTSIATSTTKTMSVSATETSSSSSITTSSRSAKTSPVPTTTKHQTSRATESTRLSPPTSATTTAAMSSRSANHTTTNAPTTSIITAGAPPISAVRRWGIGVAVVGWVVMG